MELYKLNQGSTFENLKHFIYLTNEYGVPSTEFVDDFINQFGKIILNGNFTLNQNQFKQLDILWSNIVKQCENNNIEYKENYGNVFYNILCQKSVLKIKEDWEESEWSQLNVEDKIELLKQFIINFDEYKDELIEDEEKQLITDKECADNTDIGAIHVKDSLKITEEISIKDEKVVENSEEMCYNNIAKTIEIVKNNVVQNKSTLLKDADELKVDNEEEEKEVYQLDFEKTPKLIMRDSNNRQYIKVMYKNNSFKAYGKLYKDNSLVVDANSTLDLIKESASNSTIKLREKYADKIKYEFTLIEDIKFETPSGAGCFVYGTSSSGWDSWLNLYGNPISIYKIEAEPKLKPISLTDYAKVKEYRCLTDKFNNVLKLDTLTGNIEIVHNSLKLEVTEFTSIVDYCYHLMIDKKYGEENSLRALCTSDSIKNVIKKLNLVIQNSSISALVLFNLEEES